MADAFSMFIGAVIGRSLGAAGMRGGVSLGNTLGRVISGTVNPKEEKDGKLPDEVKSLLKQPLHLLMPDLPKTAYQPLLQNGQYFASNERGESVGEGFKSVLDALKHMDDLILSQRAQFISAKTGVPLAVNEAGDIVRAGGAARLRVERARAAPELQRRALAGLAQVARGPVELRARLVRLRCPTRSPRSLWRRWPLVQWPQRLRLSLKTGPKACCNPARSCAGSMGKSTSRSRDMNETRSFGSAIRGLPRRAPHPPWPNPSAGSRTNCGR